MGGSNRPLGRRHYQRESELYKSSSQLLDGRASMVLLDNGSRKSSNSNNQDAFAGFGYAEASEVGPLEVIPDSYI